MKKTPKEDVERLFEGFFDDPFIANMRRMFPLWKRLKETNGFTPTIDMYDEKDEMVVKADIPGVKKEDVHISLMDNTLIIRGEIKKEKEKKEEDYYYSERSYGNFSRTIILPVKVQSKKIKANFKNGVLEIHLPKSPEAKQKEIQIEAV